MPIGGHSRWSRSAISSIDVDLVEQDEINDHTDHAA
jgi:hypothetical protein